MLSGKSFVICGLSRLSVRLARSLHRQSASVTVIVYEGDKASLQANLPPSVTILKANPENATKTLIEAKCGEAECLLAVSDDDLANLRSTVGARSVAPNVPVVIRAFDPSLADQFEQGLNVRRAFSVSALAAPAFAAAAAGGTVLESLRLGNEIVTFCRLTLGHQSSLIGKSAAAVSAEHSISVIATKRAGAPGSETAEPGDRLAGGDSLIIGGPAQQCLRLLVESTEHQEHRRTRRRQARPIWPRLRRRRQLNWLPQLAAVLILLVVTSIAVFAKVLHLKLVDAIYFVITTMTTTGYGDISLLNAPDWIKLYDGLIMLSGAALLGIMFSYLASIATAERLHATMERRAESMSGHTIVIGLGNVGYRVTQSLTALGVQVTAVDVAPRARFVETVRDQAPVLTGDGRLTDTLERAAVHSAHSIIACSSDDMANVEACLHARQLNPTIRTVARVYDDAVVEALSSAFSIDAVLSATNLAETSFFMAATDASALRTLQTGTGNFAAGRYRVDGAITAQLVDELRDRGVEAVAFHTTSGDVVSRLDGRDAFEAIVCGPEPIVRELIRNTTFPPVQPADRIGV